MKTQLPILLLGLFLSALPVPVISQTTVYSLRSAVDLELKIAKKLKLEITPEYRYDPVNQSGSMLIQAGVNYKLANWFSLGAYYRLDGSQTTDIEPVEESSWAISNRFALDANAKLNLNRLTPKFRVRFSNFTDFDSGTDDKSNFLRYRVGLDYNLKGIKLTPFVSAEFYHKLSSGLLSKSRFTLGAEYEFNKHNAISAGYSYARKFKTVTDYHIFELTYRIGF
jgi:hypothetical protein